MGIESAVILLSGGLDSATSLAIARRDHDVHALTFDYGSRHSREIRAADAIARHYHVRDHRIIVVQMDMIGGSALTQPGQPIDMDKPLEDIGRTIPATYVPARNMTFLSLGVAMAEAVGASKVFIGANAVDYSGYPDCRPEFISAFERAAELGTKAGCEGKPVRIEAPLIRMSKAEIIRKGTELEVPFELTWNCYLGGETACGTCEACRLRLAGFKEAGIDDPIEYSD